MIIFFTIIYFDIGFQYFLYDNNETLNVWRTKDRLAWPVSFFHQLQLPNLSGFFTIFLKFHLILTLASWRTLFNDNMHLHWQGTLISTMVIKLTLTNNCCNCCLNLFHYGFDLRCINNTRAFFFLNDFFLSFSIIL